MNRPTYIESHQTLVIDNGTGFTKMGFASDSQPAFTMPTLYCGAQERNRDVRHINQELLQHWIGFEAEKYAVENKLAGTKPMAKGFVQDWSIMQKYWHQSIFSYMRADPAQSYVILTEPPMNPPENRQMMAQIMFQTFNVAGLYIGVQAVFSLVSALGNDQQKELTKINFTGTVLDSGDGVTHVIPVVDGFVIDTCVQHIPIAGSNITNYIAAMLRNRREKIPPEMVKKFASTIKEKYCFVGPNGLLPEFQNWDNRMKTPEQLKKYNREVVLKNPYNGQDIKVTAGPQLFMAPQIFFTPQIVSTDHKAPIDELIDRAIQMSPLMSRRELYENISLSGGSVLFKGLAERVQADLTKRVDDRLRRINDAKGQNLKYKKPVVKVLPNTFRQSAVWQGAALLARSSAFAQAVHTREEYLQRGPSICRFNIMKSM